MLNNSVNDPLQQFVDLQGLKPNKNQNLSLNPDFPSNWITRVNLSNPKASQHEKGTTLPEDLKISEKYINKHVNNKMKIKDLTGKKLIQEQESYILKL